MLKNKLPSFYNLEEGSNLSKLISIFEDEIDLLNSNIDWLDLNTSIADSYGETLDRIGVILQQPRGELTDEVYRVVLRGAVAKNTSDGSVNKLISVIANMMNIDTSEVVIQQNLDDEPAEVYIAAPLEAIGTTGISRSQFVSIMNNIVAAGIEVQTLLSGTFYLSDSTDWPETSVSEGLADESDLETGGTLGAWYETDDKATIPGWD